MKTSETGFRCRSNQYADFASFAPASGRTGGILGERHVNVLELSLALDAAHAGK